MAGLRLRKVMQYRTDDLRIKEIKELLPPAKLLADFPISEKAAQTVYETRQEIHRILHGADDRLLLIAGPCSIHDTKAAKEYATRLKQTQDRCAPALLILMRVYFEKPRTTSLSSCGSGRVPSVGARSGSTFTAPGQCIWNAVPSRKTPFQSGLRLLTPRS